MATDSPILIRTAAPLSLPGWFKHLSADDRSDPNWLGANKLRFTYRRILATAVAAASPTEYLLFQAKPTLPEPTPSSELTVMTANLWHDWPRQRRLLSRLEAFAAMVQRERVDVLLLQEVSRTPDLHVDAWLGQQLGMAYVYARANGDEAALGFEEGLAVFSRFALTAPRLRQLQPEPLPFVRRLALGVTVRTSWGEIPAFSVHLALARRQNAAQLDDLRRWIGDAPAIIGGDFNAHETTPQIQGASRQ